jgi:hypothetical protein
MYSIYDGKRKVDNTMSDQIEREQQIEEESLTKNTRRSSLQCSSTRRSSKDGILHK